MADDPSAVADFCNKIGQQAKIFDYLVGAGEERGSEGQLDFFRGFRIDDKLESVRGLHRQVCGLCSF
jgi:hypothetical protein